MSFKKVLVSAFFLSLSLFAAPSSAQSLVTPPSNVANQIQSLGSCEAIYKTEDFSFKFRDLPPEVRPYQTVVIEGELINKGKILVDDADLYLVVKQISGKSEILEYKKLDKKINIAPQQEINISETWNVPGSITDGKYRIEFLLVVGGKQAIPVLPLVGNVIVDGASSESAEILSASIVKKQNGSEVVSMQVKNLSTAAITVPLRVKVYVGNDFNGKPFEEKNGIAKIQPGATTRVEVPISNLGLKKKTVHVGYLTGLDFMKYTKLPPSDASVGSLTVGGLYQSNGETYLFSCLGSADFQKLEKTKVVFDISNTSNGKIKSFEWAALSTSTKGAVSTKLSDAEYKKIGGMATVTVWLYQGEAVVDKVVYLYKCEAGDKGGMCEGFSGNNVIQNFFLKYKFILIILAIIAIIFFAISSGLYKKITSRKLFAITFILALGISAFPGVASAQVDWRERIKSIIYNTEDNYNSSFFTDFVADFKDLTGSFFVSHTGYTITSPSCGSYSCQGTVFNTNENLPATTATYVYDSDGHSYRAAGSQLGAYRNYIYIPTWLGVYVIDEINPTAFINSSSFKYGNWDGSNKWEIGEVGNEDIRWFVPVGTKIGFLLSTDHPDHDSYLIEGNVGTYVPTLSTGGLSPCENDGNVSFPWSMDEPAVRDSEPCLTGEGNPHRNISTQMIRPTPTLSGLEGHFSCEALQADGTMECVATTPGTTTPVVSLNPTTAVFRGATSWTEIYEGAWYTSGVDQQDYYLSGPYEDERIVHVVALRDTADPAPLNIIPYTGSTSGDNWWNSVFMGHASVGSGGLTNIPGGTSDAVFGQIVVTEASVPPSAPTVTQVGPGWSYGGSFSMFAFQATSTELNANQGIIFEVDSNNNGTVDQTVRLYDCYDLLQDSCLNQPSWQGDQYPEDAYFSWDNWLAYVPSGYPLRFNVYYDGSGTYPLKVRAMDNTGLRSDWSTIMVNVEGGPAAPSNLTSDYAYEACIEGITLSWDASPSSDITGYNIYRYDSESSDYDLIAEVASTTLTYYDEEYAPGFTYYMVTATNDVMESDGAYYSENLPPSCDALLPPSNVDVVEDPDTCGGYVNITWDAGLNAQAYSIEKFDYDIYEWVEVGTTTALSFNHIAGVDTYAEYRVLSMRGAGLDLEKSTPSLVDGDYGSRSCFVPLPPNGAGTKGATCGFQTDFTWTLAGSGTTPEGFRIYQYWYGYFYIIADISDPDARSYTYVGYDEEPQVYAISSYNEEHGEGDAAFVNPTTVDGEPFGLAITPSRDCDDPPECSDEEDNDGNGKIDFTGGPGGEPADDEYCESAEDDLEGDPGCIRGNITRLDGQSYTFYSTGLASSSAACDLYSKVLTCDGGQWKDSGGNVDNGSVYTYPVCRINANVIER